MTTSLKTNKGNSKKLSKQSKTSSFVIPNSLPFKARRILKRVREYAAAHELWNHRPHILVAVSGGPDSVCLLDMLAFLAKKNTFTLAIAHVNYQLRGVDSLKDESFVRSLASDYHVPCFVKRYPKSAKKQDEQTLRNFRYSFFESLCQKHGFTRIALGHQKSDQTETFLLNLLRGSGPVGLSSMLPRHNLRIRPLLDLDRSDILQYLEARSLTFRTDSSNTDIRYTRNRIRHVLLPFLKQHFNPNIISTLAHSATLFQETIHQEKPLQEFCPIIFTNQTASFSQKDFMSLTKQDQRLLLRSLVRTLSSVSWIPSYNQTNELIKGISGTKTDSVSITTGALKLTRKGATVLLLYSLP